eukprot:CAMPEP_0169350220 /NCGR_PEP_ID=MMETSP1017-20121227/24126_1 /TAXON_ID=342587 /ORGANISM="Karlodinium micrum, Strain CCMP2283" /LENGTH=215 /DNA_ID=CAMNT_0009446393 /DNA_START=44 /DNA_END=692 /DNA_ORIENTATION=+
MASKPQFEVAGRKTQCGSEGFGGLEGASHAEVMTVMKTVGSCKYVHINSNGTGFAYFGSPEEASTAIASLNGTNGMQVDTYNAKKKPSGQRPAWKSGGKGWNSKGSSGSGNQTNMVIQALLKQIQGGGGQGAGAGQKRKVKDCSGGNLGEHVGLITSSGPKYGFIECEALKAHGGEVFILADEMKAYKVGMTVKFKAFLDGKNRLQGRDLKSGLK